MDPQTMTALLDLARYLIVTEPVLAAVVFFAAAVVAVAVMVIALIREFRPRS